MDEYIRKQNAIIEMMDNDVDHEQGTDGREVVQILLDIPAADVVEVVRCKNCIYNNDCDIQYSAQAGDNFFCGFGDTKKDVREDIVYE